MASVLLSLAISAVLVGTVLVALFSKKVSVSLIGLFYASITLGVAFTVYGDALVGLVQIATFAGAVSVLLLTVILMTGESKLNLGARKTAVALSAGVLVLAAVALLAVTSTLASNLAQEYQDVSLQMFGFLWDFRPWDLLIVITVFTAAMVTVVNLFSGEN
ncbi:MAG: hypothetical protein OK438_06305 [Thaumarchaeota archaeon]|nr:hypothetical protein [Nitrososphaerota archaeon]